MKLTPQHIANSKVNYDIQNAAQNYHRPQNVNPVYANLNEAIQRKATW
jgi:hypothetical protein